MRNLIVFTVVLALTLLGSVAMAADDILGMTGNVGIGTASPATKLHVTGTISTPPSGTILAPSDANWNNAGTFISAGWTANLGDYARYALGGNGGDTRYMTISGVQGFLFNGNVGIGTASPATKLHVTGTISTPPSGTILAPWDANWNNAGTFISAGWTADLGSYARYALGGNGGDTRYMTISEAQGFLFEGGDIIANNIDALDVSVVIGGVPVSVAASIEAAAQGATYAALLARVNAIEAALSKPGASGISRYGQ